VTWPRALAVALALLAVAPHVASAQDARDGGDAARRRFVQQYMAAIRDRDVAAITRLTHPASLACIDDASRAFFDSILRGELRHAATVAGYRITRIAPAGAPSLPGVPDGMFREPVAATHEFQVDFGANAASTTLIRRIAPLDGAWYTVVPCPTAEGLERFRERDVRRREQRAQAETLAAELKEPLVSELKALLAAHRRLDAVRRYREASGADLTTAVAVIDVLSGRE
jgi:hypothetical protein